MLREKIKEHYVKELNSDAIMVYISLISFIECHSRIF